MAAIRYLANRLITYSINDTNKKKEYDTIKQIMRNNKYDTQISDKIISTINAKTKTQTQKETFNIETKSKTRWATFTYVGQQTKFITKLFKNTSLDIGFKTDNTTEKLLTCMKINNETITSDKLKKKWSLPTEMQRL